MGVKILSRRSNYLERAIIFEVDGEIKNIAAPRDAKSFDDLLKQIETEYGAVDAAETGTTKPSVGGVEAVAEVVTEPADAPAEPEPTATTTAKKTSSKKKAKG